MKVIINLLKKYRGYATTLISLYINGNRPIPDVVSMLRQEWALASNIKDKTTRTHVQDALERIINSIKGISKAPENGLVIFAGFNMKSPGNYDWVFHAIIPPLPVSTFKYICDTSFHTEILESMMQTSDTYGIIVVERGEAVIALLRGNYWEIVDKVEFFVPNKHSAGGQSALRYKRQTEHLAETFYKLLAERANKIFTELPNLKGIVVAGPGPTKEEFLEEGGLDHRIRDKVIAVVPACCADIGGVLEAIRNAEDKLKETEYVKAKKLMEQVMYLAVKKPEYLVYGKEQVMDAIRKGIARVVIVSEDVGEDEIMGLTMALRNRKDVELFVMPKSVEENLTLTQTFGGYAAILTTPSWIMNQETGQ
ncbi:peptide chain release factor aRF-1 [Vulcanisaeta thermophila]|uniref:peptide chain release factor aRF-1 n=1 Tax=Vulcanisaeta thermophila TaxID=867917 RepID=UPI00350E58C9